MALTQNQTILLGTVIVTAIVVSLVLLGFTRTISNVGRIRAIGIEVYSDPEATTVLTHIDWGTVGPNDIEAVNIYLKNTKNVNVTLTMNETAWSPSNASNYLFLSWNYTTGTVITPLQVIAIQVQIQVSPSIQGIDTFSFNININASEFK